MTEATSTLQATVIVPTTGNRGPLLPYSVGSVLAQSVGDIEVFIIGDGVDDATRAVIFELMQCDARVRFFDHPKDVRRGETYRHLALQDARGEIVCYLTDRDLMLPNHVAVMSGLLANADFAHTLRFKIPPNGIPKFDHTLDINDAADRKAAPNAVHLIPLSFGGHTCRMYRKLPHGWRTTPTNKYTDFYMWEQFLAQPTCRTATSTKPTILYFKRGAHPGWPVDQRLAELKRWSVRINDPVWLEEFQESVRDAAIRDRARLARSAPAVSPSLPITAPAPSPLPDRAEKNLASGRKNKGKSAPRRFAAFLDRFKKLVPNLSGWTERRIRYLREEPPRSIGSHITDLKTKRLQRHLRIETYWVGGRFGPGPGASVYALDDEVMRFDCFGEPRGHMHINLKQARLYSGGGSARIKLAGNLTENIERAFYELAHNLEYCLKVNRNQRIRRIRLDRTKLAECANWMRGNLLQLSAEGPKETAREDVLLASISDAEEDT